MDLSKPTPPMRARSVLILVLLLCGSLPRETSSFEGSRAGQIVVELASDAYAGRQSGQPGGVRAEEWIAERFAQWGLEPAGTTGSFFHEFSLLATRERAASLTLIDSPFGRIDFLYGDDFTLVTNSGSGDVTAEAVLVGHGLCSPDREWNDYEGPEGEIDVAGKIAVIVRGTPDNGYDWGEGGSRDSTLHEAMRRGAAAVFFYSHDHDHAVQGAAVHEGSYFPETPIGIASGHLLDHLLMNTGWDLERYEKELGKNPTLLVTGKSLRFRTRVTREPEGTARNVVGVLRGGDPRLAQEILVIGGHMDHVGTNGEGIVYNGANDNASGTSVVMELARSFAGNASPPARTIVFVTFAGEEQGLLGSQAFVRNPPIEMDGVAAMINFDMAGHGDGKVGLGGSEHWPEIRESFRASLDPARAESLVVGRAWRSGSSDHSPFRDAGIPTMNIWSEGNHRFYHTLQDDARWVDETVLESVGRMAEGWIRTLADWPEPLLDGHRAGRAMLYAADQIDFEGVLDDAGGDAPPWVRAGVRWFDAREFASPSYLDAVADLHRRADAESIAIVRAPRDVRDATKPGNRAVIVGLRGSGGGDPATAVPERRRALLAGLDVGILRLGEAPGDSVSLAAVVQAGVVLLAPPDSALLAALPESAERCIRFRPAPGQSVPAPDSLPRKNTLFVLACEARLGAARVAETVRALSADRVHLDVVPWLVDSDEAALCAFLEELQAAGPFSPDQMTSLLGGNLGRL